LLSLTAGHVFDVSLKRFIVTGDMKLFSPSGDETTKPISIDLRSTANHAFPNCFFLIVKIVDGVVSSETILEVCPNDKTAEVLSYSDGPVYSNFYENLIESYDMYKVATRNRKVSVGDYFLSSGVFPGDAAFEQHLLAAYIDLKGSDTTEDTKKRIIGLMDTFTPYAQL
jgi:hypothetical protein